jgi:hypothetical protein
VDLVHLLRTLRPRTPAVAVDFGAVGDSPDPLVSPPLDLAEGLADLGVPLVPVLRPYEGRLDARVWGRLREPGLGYADYGVTSPVRRAGVPYHRQLPTLRYTAERDWWIYRWARRGGRSDDRCHDLCRTLIGSPHWPALGARFSWGDAQIARRARSARGAGSSSGWMAWSTSHHLAYVRHALTPA